VTSVERDWRGETIKKSFFFFSLFLSPYRQCARGVQARDARRARRAGLHV